MAALDGLYRHRGHTLTWDDQGISLAKQGRVEQLSWHDVLGVRQFEGDPQYVQVKVKGHLPAPRPSEDHFAIPVNSEADANRLLTTISWQAGRTHPPSLEADQG